MYVPQMLWHAACVPIYVDMHLYVREGLWVCMSVSLIVMIDDCAICVSRVKLFYTVICLQSGPVVPLTLLAPFQSSRAKDSAVCAC